MIKEIMTNNWVRTISCGVIVGLLVPIIRRQISLIKMCISEMSNIENVIVLYMFWCLNLFVIPREKGNPKHNNKIEITIKEYKPTHEDYLVNGLKESLDEINILRNKSLLVRIISHRVVKYVNVVVGINNGSIQIDDKGENNRLIERAYKYVCNIAKKNKYNGYITRENHIDELSDEEFWKQESMKIAGKIEPLIQTTSIAGKLLINNSNNRGII